MFLQQTVNFNEKCCMFCNSDVLLYDTQRETYTFSLYISADNTIMLADNAVYHYYFGELVRQIPREYQFIFTSIVTHISIGKHGTNHFICKCYPLPVNVLCPTRNVKHFYFNFIRIQVVISNYRGWQLKADRLGFSCPTILFH